MSRLTLAQRLALRMSDGTLSALPRFAPAAHPLQVRAYLGAFYRLLDVARVHKAHIGASGDVRDMIAASKVIGDLEDAIAACNAWLRRVARAGGRGTPAGAGRGPAAMGQGWPALASAVGPAPSATGGGAIAPPSHPVPADLLSGGA